MSEGLLAVCDNIVNELQYTNKSHKFYLIFVQRISEKNALLQTFVVYEIVDLFIFV
jgi:hypothetical protein